MDLKLIVMFVVFAGILGYVLLMPGPAAVPTATVAPGAAPAVDPSYKPAVDLKFTALDGTPVDLATMKGKVVLIDFWATWCPPCRGEVPNVVAAYEAYHKRGFEVIGISLDQDDGALRSFTAQNGMAWPQYFDGRGWDNAMAQKFDIHSIPAMWLIGKDGQIITTNARENLAGYVESALGR